jgi:hypothetical protein
VALSRTTKVLDQGDGWGTPRSLLVAAESSGTVERDRSITFVKPLRRSSAAFRLRAIATRDGSVEPSGGCGVPQKHPTMIEALPFLSSLLGSCRTSSQERVSTVRRKQRIVDIEAAYEPQPTDIRAGFGHFTRLERSRTIALPA